MEEIEKVLQNTMKIVTIFQGTDTFYYLNCSRTQQKMKQSSFLCKL